jgi:chromosome segregation ATPase
MSAAMLTYATLGAHLKISPEAARSLAKRLRLPRSLSQDGKALVSVDLAEIRHTPRAPSAHGKGTIEAKIETLQAEIARLEATAAGHRADFEHERERADRLMTELLRATAETMAVKEATAGLDGELAASRAVGPGTGQGQAVSRIRHLAATLVEADRRACK